MLINLIRRFKRTRKLRIHNKLLNKIRAKLKSISIARTYQKKYRILCLTALLLLNPIIFYVINSDKNIYETFLVCLLICIIITSLVFWSNPKKKSKAHYVDGILVKTSITLFILYILFLKHLSISFLCFAIIILSCICVSYYFSNLFSRIEWCGEKHIQVHGLVHAFGTLGALFAFV